MNMMKHGNPNPRVEFINADKKLLIVPDESSYCLYRILNSEERSKSGKSQPSQLQSHKIQYQETETETENETETDYDIVHENKTEEYTISYENVKEKKLKIKEQKKVLEKQKYLQRKMNAVDISNQLLKKMNMTYYEWFQKQSKKDDLADSLLMTLYCALDREWL
jgi:hypothetical protein